MAELINNIELNEKQWFYLMHKNDIVTTLKIDINSGAIVDIGQRGEKDLLPLGGCQSQKDLKNWWQRRAVPITQDKIKEILRQLNLVNSQSFLVQNLGLSLIDHYWIKPYDKELYWENINLFTNSFTDLNTNVLVSETDSNIDIKSYLFTPSASLQGELTKKWVIDSKSHDRYLIKGNYGDTFQQSVNEVIATSLHRKQGIFPFTEYSLTNLDTNMGKGIGCLCKCFASEKIEFIPAIDIVTSRKKTNDLSEYEFFIKLCEENGLDPSYVRSFLEYQILSDFAITNTDRHFNNFGVLRDTDSLKFIGLAPIYDSGNSLFFRMPVVPTGDDLLRIGVTSFKKTEIELLRYIQDKNILNLNKLPAATEMERELIKSNQSPERIKSIIEGYHKKIDLLDKFQHNIKIEDSRHKGYVKKSRDFR